MRILVLGGTSFVGRHFVDIAVGAGHNVTLFHRGKTGSDLFPVGEHVHGDREFDLDRDPLTTFIWDGSDYLQERS